MSANITPEQALAKVPPIRPQSSLDGLAQMVADLPGSLTIVEVGCYAGESTEILARKAKRLICVDPWDPKTPGLYPEGVTADDVKLAFDVRMARWGKLIDIIVLRTRSEDAAILIPNGSVDLSYIDADHHYSAVSADIKAWLPTVKPGGLIGGHDYDDQQWMDHVNRAVDELLGKPDKVYPDCSWIKRL